eukprot:CAMPEP_0118828844 /NCGR_PEP_ID=MMETSP1162-20130426/20891_1 /TAXON_ID=33656 /ORGANISM="Phaeocystis Sp, Strain CCMP2710" /LENGTH=275 /DNA_ID=CAMNT_0006759925 /DNA_START=47 /DNA_END=872 /DNA_ORIENTATION=+
MSEEDPFTLVQEEASRSLLDVQAQLAHWRELSSSTSEMDHTEANQVKVHLTATIGELQLDLDAMQSAVDHAAGDHAKFGIAHDELERRRAFISQTRAEANAIRDTLAAAKSVRSARKERLERQGLLAGRGSSSCEMASGAAASVEKIAEAGRLQRGVHQAHEDELQEQAQLQRAMVAEQDDNLGMLSSTMTRLGQMGLAIKDELIAQGRALDELTDEVDSTASKMKQAQQVMTKLLKSKDRGLFCCILALTITLGVLVYLSSSPSLLHLTPPAHP